MENSSEKNYLEINRELWNRRTDVHVNSSFYDIDNFITGKTSLNSIELGLIGDLTDKSILHLQCHFGQDSISLARLGAIVTGVDLSDKAIDVASKLAKELQANARFICCDVYELPNLLDQKFDMVFTTYGTIGWLPDINKWANVISHFLKPGGKLIFVDFHPVLWMFDNDFKQIAYRYFNSDAIVEVESGTYANTSANINLKSVGWNHGIAEVLNALLQSRMEINAIDEIDYSPYDCFGPTIELEKGKYRIEHLGDKIPMVYSVVATNTSNNSQK